jgi:thiosulfate reductase cytochrome b subunit
MAGRLRELGVKEPRILGEVEPYPIHHGVVEGEWATRDCKSCHAPESRLGGPVVLADAAPEGVVPRLIPEAKAEFLGGPTLDESGRIVYTPVPSTAGLYILGHDSIRWANLLGILAIVATLLGVGIHGGLRWRTAHRRGPVAHEEGPRVYMYSAYERAWHWLQALAIMILLFTGLEIHVISLGIMDFALAVRVHNIMGFVVLANAVFAAFFHLASGEIRQFLPEPKGFFGQAFEQTRYYLSGIFRGDPHPFEKSPSRKLNPLQQLTYLGILNVLLPLQIVTGVLIWGLQRWPAIDGPLNGLTLLAPLHALGAWLFAAFLIMHVYLTTTGPTPTANLKAMMVGWETVEASQGGSEAR